MRKDRNKRSLTEFQARALNLILRKPRHAGSFAAAMGYKFMAQIGNANNCKLNGEWAKHVRGKFKRYTSKVRRAVDKKIIRQTLSN
jgi:hypothetical protein